LFEETGYNYILVQEQATPDPDFSNTLIPNPEDPKAYILALEYARKHDADIVLSTDPDADRMGVQVKHNGDYVFLTGNQTGALLIEYICHSLKNQNRLPDNGIMITTIVTNDLGNVIAQDYGIKVVLGFTGFKWIGEKIAEYCDEQGMEFVFGYEESYGSIVKDFVRDKDSLQACLILSEAANYYKSQGKTLVDVVNDLYRRYGYYFDRQDNIVLPGADGTAKIQAIMANLRTNPPQEFGGLKVIKSEDYLNLKVKVNDQEEDITGFVSSDVLKYFLEDNCWLAIRPSGTEPKCKIYYCVKGDTLEVAQAITEKIKISVDKYLGL
jgi:phosphoglucomutase